MAKKKKTVKKKQEGINGVTFKMLVDAIRTASQKNVFFRNQRLVLIVPEAGRRDQASVYSGLTREEVALIHGAGVTFADRGVASVFSKDKVLRGLLVKLQEVGRITGAGVIKE